MEVEQSTREKFGAYLRSLRERAGLSLREVGEKAGVSYPYLGQLETGQRNPPSRRVLSRLAEVYQVDEEKLAQEAGYMKGGIGSLSPERIAWAFETVCRDPEFAYGTLVRQQELSLEVKAFIVELYQQWIGRQLLLEDENKSLPRLLLGALTQRKKKPNRPDYSSLDEALKRSAEERERRSNLLDEALQGSEKERLKRSSLVTSVVEAGATEGELEAHESLNEELYLTLYSMKVLLPSVRQKLESMSLSHDYRQVLKSEIANLQEELNAMEATLEQHGSSSEESSEKAGEPLKPSRV